MKIYSVKAQGKKGFDKQLLFLLISNAVFKHRVKLMHNFFKPVLSAAVLFLLILTSCTREDYNLKMVAVKDNNTIWIMNVDGSDRKALTNTAEDGNCSDPSWSADGEKIVYISELNPDFRLCTMNSDGSGKRILYVSLDSLSDPSFSPDGNRIIFRCAIGDLREYNFKTGMTVNLNNFGVLITFISLLADGTISVLHMNGWDVYSPTTGVWIPNGGINNWGATYSPDGRSIAYVNSSALYITVSDTSTLDGTGFLLTNAVQVSDSQIAWDPSGEYIYYHTLSGISRILADNTGMELVVNDPDFTYPQIQGKSK
jgi:Tol biopolymer transport system component